MRVALITPTAANCAGNVGAQMITSGIRHLIVSAIPEARFVDVEMLADDERQWRAAETCDAAVICGNPRFSVSPDDAWWECGIWSRIEELAQAGVRVIDGWAGATATLDCDDAVSALLDRPRVQHALGSAKCLSGRIARDRTAKAIYESAGQSCELLPCSSWWAKYEYGIEAQMSRDQNAIVLLEMAAHEWAPESIKELQGRMAPCEVIAVNCGDYEWAVTNRIDATLVSDAGSLLRTYARCDVVVSLRVHAAIPAASLGCEVGILAVDSRALIAEPFGIPVSPFTDLQFGAIPPASFASIPDKRAVAETLRRMLC